MDRTTLTWWGIVRLGFVQTSLGAIVVLTTATMNRVMVVEYALPAMIPGALVAFHYIVQLSRPRFGYGSDLGSRRTPWIIGGMLVLGLGGIGAAVGTVLMGVNFILGLIVSFFAFILIGAGVGASGTSLLALLAKRVVPERRPPAATIVWFMMILGFAVTAGLAGHFLDPFSPRRLIMVTATVSLIAFCVTCLALWDLERGAAPLAEAKPAESTNKPRFRKALEEVWREREARRFTIFVFVSMLAYSAQDLILEPFAGTVFGMTPGESTQLSGLQHSGVLAGMILVALSGVFLKRYKHAVLTVFVVGGCIASAVALGCIAAAGFRPDTGILKITVFSLGVANGAFAVAAIGSMMALAGKGRANREGLRMGLWGAAQAIAFGLGGFLGTVAVDVSRAIYADPALAYAIVFTAEAFLFLVSAIIGASIRQISRSNDELSRSNNSLVQDVGIANLAEVR